MKRQVDELLARIDVLPTELAGAAWTRHTRHSAGLALPLVV